ncbi:MAG: GDYXXLXY domain-containing protein [Thermoguttaceae bacterium]|jgi:uncharacterized membrane-anchored protein
MFDSGTSVSLIPGWFDRPASWIKGHERLLIIGGIILQLIVLVGMIAMRLAPILTGNTILLRVVPVDPRDIFRGDYVVLGYECSRIPAAGIAGLQSYHNYDFRDVQDQTVYVTLAPESDGRHWRPEQYSTERPKQGIYLRGKIQGWQIQYGIESFYVQEGKGHDYENAVRNRKLSAKISVTAGGEAVLRDLVIE